MDARARLPILEWLPRVRSDGLRADAAAGLTVAVVLIPQAMGYALLAGVPPIHGLYAALLPPLVYALFGTGRVSAVGPAALDALLTAAAVSAVVPSGGTQYASSVVALAALVGGMQLLLRALGLSFAVNFLSRPVVSGFTSAAALAIGVSQLGLLLGIALPRGTYVHVALYQAFSHFEQWNTPTVVLSALSVALLLALKRLSPRLPRAMIAVVLGTLAVWAFRLDARGIAVVGAVPAGLPALSLPRMSLAALPLLSSSALTIALVGYTEAISVGRHFARLGRYDLRPENELFALGMANAAGSLVGGFPVTAGLARTAVNAQAGARTPLAGVAAAALVALTLLLLTPLFYYLPKAVLAAIIVNAVFGLFDLREPRRLWAIKRVDFWLLALTFVATLAVGIQYGILVGVGASLLMFLLGTSRPHFAVLGRIPGTEAYLNVARHPHAITLPAVLVLRIDAQLYFGNVSFLKDTLRALEAGAQEPLRAVVLDASGVNQLDSAAEDALSEIDLRYAERGVRLLFAHVKGPVRDVMYRTGFLERLSQSDRIFLRTHDAVLAAIGQRAQHGAPVQAEDVRAPADRVGCGGPPSVPAPEPEAELDAGPGAGRDRM